MPLPKRIRSSSPTSTTEQCSSPSAISRYTSHDSYLTYVPPPLASPDQRPNVNNTSHIEIDLADEALWDDWDLPSTVIKKTPGKIRTMSSPAVHSRTKHIPETTTIVEVAAKEPTPTTVAIVWDDDDDDFEQLLSQFPGDGPPGKPCADENSPLATTPTMDEDENTTRLDATRRSSAMLTTDNQSFVHNTTRIELSSQPQLSADRPSTASLQRASTGPLSPLVTKAIESSQARSPRVRCDSSSTLPPKKVPCTEAEIEQKRLAALAIRRQRQEEQQRKKQLA